MRGRYSINAHSVCTRLRDIKSIKGTFVWQKDYTLSTILSQTKNGHIRIWVHVITTKMFISCWNMKKELSHYIEKSLCYTIVPIISHTYLSKRLPCSLLIGENGDKFKYKRHSILRCIGFITSTSPPTLHVHPSQTFVRLSIFYQTMSNYQNN